MIADVMTAAGPDIGGLVWDLIFWVVARTAVAVAIFWSLVVLGTLLAEATERKGFAVVGVVLAFLGAGAWWVYALYLAIVSLITLVNALGWFQ